MEYLQFGSITIFERVWRCTLSPGWGQGQGEPTGRTWSLPVSVTVRAVLLIFTSYSKIRWPALLPCDVLPWQLGGDQGGCHPCSAGGGYKVEPFLSFIGLFFTHLCAGKNRLQRSRRSRWKSWKCKRLTNIGVKFCQPGTLKAPQIYERLSQHCHCFLMF